MEAIKLKPSLEKFLKENDIYDSYIRNFILYHDGEDYHGYADIISELIGEECFTGAFLFDNTAEGVEYWFKFAREFDKLDGDGKDR